MYVLNKAIFVGFVCLIIGACASLPQQIEELETARADVAAVDNDPMAQEVAALELRSARRALKTAEQAYAANKSLAEVQHEAYVASLHAKIAQEQIAEAKAQKKIEAGEAERNRVLLEARTVDADRARTQAEQRAAEAEERAREAELARQQAAAALEEARRLEEELKNLQAKQTERGMVLTLGDVLFDTNKANLLPGADATVGRLADFLRQYPERRVLIEGHTDARGSDEYNMELSDKRAKAVREALLDEGIRRERIRARGMGEAYPVASNETATGMQQNRRVEIVISDDSGEFPAAAER